MKPEIFHVFYKRRGIDFFFVEISGAYNNVSDFYYTKPPSGMYDVIIDLRHYSKLGDLYHLSKIAKMFVNSECYKSWEKQITRNENIESIIR